MAWSGVDAVEDLEFVGQVMLQSLKHQVLAPLPSAFGAEESEAWANGGHRGDLVGWIVGPE